MLGIGMVVVLFGYGLTFFGWQVWEGCNPNLIDVFWPGKYQKCGGTTTQNTTANQGVNSSNSTSNINTGGQKLGPGQVPPAGIKG